MPDIHPHALKGAIVSLAVMWRLPVLHARDPEDALRILEPPILRWLYVRRSYKQAFDIDFGPEVVRLYDEWDAFREFAATVTTPTGPLVEAALRNPVPRPRQVFAIGLNYRSHAEESNLAIPTEPVTFTKFASCLTGPSGDLSLAGDQVDWEVELVVVMGNGGRDIAEQDAWTHVAGLTVGQDISDRRLQLVSSPPQFSLGKSRAGYGPIGPALVSVDLLEDPEQRRRLLARH